MISKLKTNLTNVDDVPYVYQTDLINEMDIEQLALFVKQIKKEKLQFKNLLEKFEDLTPKKFFTQAKYFYEFSTEKIKDALIKKQFANAVELKVLTKDIYVEYTKMGYGSDSLWNKQYFWADYIVLAKNGVIDCHKIYTKQEIADLVKAKKVYVKDIACSKTLVDIDRKDIKTAIKWLKEIKVDSDVDKLAKGFFKKSSRLTPEDLKEMQAQNGNVFGMIYKEFSFEKMCDDYSKFLKQYEIAKHLCLKKAQKEIKESKHKIKNENDIIKYTNELTKVL